MSDSEQRLRPTVQLLHVGKAPASDVVRLLGKECTLSVSSLGELDPETRLRVEIVVVDVIGMDEADFARLTRWRFTPRGLITPLILIVDDAARKGVLQRGLNEGANLVRRPLEQITLSTLLARLQSARQAQARKKEHRTREAHYSAFPKQALGLQAGDAVLDEILGVSSSATRVDATSVLVRSEAIIECLGQSGLSDWITAVRQHHDSTYQHCLLVTGTLLAIGHHLKMRHLDLGRLAVGGLLHDIGKADIPLAILEKPSTLSPSELIVMRSHPMAGVERLAEVKGVAPEVMTLVRDHHELLDGSGYPHGLHAHQIGDFVRLLTIADVYSALMERRAYKPPMAANDAIGIMGDMREQLDQALLGAIMPVLQDVRALNQ